MVTKPRLLFGCYTVCVLLFFSITGLQVSADTTGNLSSVIDWTWLPGGFLAGWTVGVHSDHFILGAFLWNIAVYLIVPFLLWKVFVRIKKQRVSALSENSGVPRKQ